jgi:hypothetical protein
MSWKASEFQVSKWRGLSPIEAVGSLPEGPFGQIFGLEAFLAAPQHNGD